jgi:SET domain-containing protein
MHGAKVAQLIRVAPTHPSAMNRNCMPSDKSIKPPIEVRNSPIHGAGAFASRKLKAGEVIGCYAGRLYSAEDVGTRHWDHAVTFVFALSDGSVIDGSQGGNATRHINHSCAPNCVAHEIEAEDGANSIQIEALRQIGAGEELFLDYALDAGDGVPEDFPCLCGETDCRGTLVAAEVRTERY